jgi:hypothetical protein
LAGGKEILATYISYSDIEGGDRFYFPEGVAVYRRFAANANLKRLACHN